MIQTKYEVGLKLSKYDIETLQRSLSRRMQVRAEDGDDVTDEALLYTMLEPHMEKIKLTEEQAELDKRINELQERRNELRT